MIYGRPGPETGMRTISKDDPITPNTVRDLEHNLYVLVCEKKPELNRKQKREWARTEAKNQLKVMKEHQTNAIKRAHRNVPGLTGIVESEGTKT